MKKFISILTAAALTAGLAAFAAGCGGSGDADLENGTLSAKGYASLTEAATACVTEEIAGDTTAATYKSYTAERLLEDKEIEKLNITDEQRAKVTRAEEGKITYSVPDADGNAQEYTTDVILVNLGTEVSYYISDPTDGENLTKSYYERVNTTDLDNFTWSMTANQTIAMGNVSVDQDISLDIKYTGTELWFKTVMPSMTTAGGEQTIELFAENDDGSIRTYTRINDGQFTTDTTADYSSLEELLEESMASSDSMAKLDHSYFVKTSFGFSLDEQKFSDFIDKMFSSMQLGADIDIGEISFDCYVTDGIVTSSSCKCEISAAAEGQTASVSMDMQMNITDIGSTTIEMPDKLTGLIQPGN